ncbi:gluconate:H+ symporter [Sporomusa termitida]|uniref:High-affinity gluconate transporter n=1 Tax=Sporomusa termitida TaxID=2377 RepID=A0A517DSM5_9FIRM|nr:gluconate:H+ symporter [Sporomusa termitida]QDR80286.1 High-affinity gluconate transporter [Sporomusa termitida]
MPVFILLLGIVFIFVLISVLRLNAFLSLMLACIFVGVAEGLPLMKVIASIEAGLGGTLGHLAIILGLGAMLGRLMSDCGAAQKIALTLVNKFGRKNVKWAMALTGFIVGIALFWEVAFVILIPIVFTVATTAELPLLEVGLPALAAISVAHCFLPPHPGPVAIANIFHANIGLTLVYGLIISIPAVLIGGPLWHKLFRKWSIEIPQGLISTKIYKEEDLPGFGVSLITAMAPVILIIGSMIGEHIVAKGSGAAAFFKFIGNTDISLLISVFLALFTFGLQRGKKLPEIMSTIEASIKAIAMIMLVIGAGGAFKQVIIDSGIAQYIASLMVGVSLSPYVMAFIVTAFIRVAVGSSTVTVFTAAGILTSLAAMPEVNKELFVLTISAASMFGLPPTDAAFWMCKEYFNLSFGQTVKVVTGMTSVIALCGLAGVLALSLVIH